MSHPPSRTICLIAHNLRSTHNVGSLLRTADGLGVSHVYLTGYTPFPAVPHDPRLPHLAQKITKDIHKTALGAEQTVSWSHSDDVNAVLQSLRADDYTIAALEQAPHSSALPEFRAPQKITIMVGREVEGIEPEILAQCDQILEIPMRGHKESFNVAQAAAMALYHCRYSS